MANWGEQVTTSPFVRYRGRIQLALSCLLLALLFGACGYAVSRPSIPASPAISTFVQPGYAACSSALTVMTWDRRLDLAAERYGHDKAEYVMFVGHWGKAIADIRAVCETACVHGDAAMPTPADRVTVEDWFSAAIATHVADRAAWPASAAWDNAWIARYIALTTFFEAM